MIKNLEKRLDSQKYNIKKFRKIMKNIYEICFKNAVFFFFLQGSVQFSHSVMTDSLRLHELQHARLTCLSPTTGNSRL